MAMFLNSSQALSGAGMNRRSQLGLDTDLVGPRYQWDYEQRGTRAVFYAGQPGWSSLWPSGAMLLAGDPNAGGILDQDIDSAASSFEEWAVGVSGAIRLRFISGVVTDSLGTPVGGVTVKAYLTSTDQEINQTVTASDGSYMVGVYTLGVNYYLVAFDTSGNRAGATVNTLQPS